MVTLNVNDVNDIKNVAEVFIKNTTLKTAGEKDPFYDDTANALVCACVGLLCEKPENSDIPYAKIDEVIGGVNAPHYESCFGNIENLLRLATITYNPQKSKIQILPGAVVDDNTSELGVIFANLKAYTKETPYCLYAWENYKIAPKKTVVKMQEVLPGSAFKPVWVPEVCVATESVKKVQSFSDTTVPKSFN